MSEFIKDRRPQNLDRSSLYFSDDRVALERNTLGSRKAFVCQFG